MKVSDILRVKGGTLYVVKPDDSLTQAMATMAEKDMGSLVVVEGGAVVGMLVGLISTCLYIFAYLGWFFIPETNMLPNTPENWLFGISPLSFGAVGAMLNFIAAYVTMLFTKPTPERVQALVESIRVPRGAGVAVDH